MKQNLRTFYLITITQVLSLIGSRMTGVAIGIRVFNDTGSATPLLLVSFFSALPLMLGGSLAGVLVDRWKRRMVLLVTDAGQALGTLLLLFSFLSGQFQLWHLYVIVLLNGALDMLQRPAMESSVTMLVPEAQRDRANAIRQITGPAAGMIAPVVTGLIYVLVGVTGVMVIDLITFLAAMVVLYLVQIPQPQRSAEGGKTSGSIWQELLAGFRFLLQRRILLALMLFAALVNFFQFGPMNMNTPYLLTLTGSEAILGVLLGMLNVGIVAGGVVVLIWGGTRPRIHGILLGLIFRGVWIMIYGLARTPFWLGVALFFVFFTTPLVDASFMSIIQLKVPPDMQGRIFSVLFQMMYIANPFSSLLTGPLVDRWLEPAVGTSGWSWLAPLLGVQPGSGMGLLLFISGGVILLLSLLVYAWPRARSVERDLPDYNPEDSRSVP